MQTGTFAKLSGTVEVDETFVGGLAKFMHKEARAKLNGAGGVDKTIVVGAIKRGTDDSPSRVSASVQPDRTHATLHALVHKTIEVGSTVYTDALPSYNGLKGIYFSHSFVDHMVEYVNGRVHTNGIENFWSLLKRGLKGTYVCAKPWNLQRYVDERVFTFNERKEGDLGRMKLVVGSVADRRLTWNELTDKQKAA